MSHKASQVQPSAQLQLILLAYEVSINLLNFSQFILLFYFAAKVHRVKNAFTCFILAFHGNILVIKC